MSDTVVPLTQCIGKAFYKIHHEIKSEKFDEYWFPGGRGSLKSSFVSIEILLGLMRDPEANAIVFRRYDNELRDSVFGQLVWAALKLDVMHLWNFNTSPMKATYTPTGQVIIFKGCDNPKKIKSINLGKGFIKFLWFEEVDQFGGMDDVRSITQSTFRGQAEARRVAFFSFNPPKSARSWVNSEVKINKRGRRIHHSTYLDAPREWLGERFLADAEHIKKINPTVYKHEYLGEEVGTGVEIFNNIALREITDIEISEFDHIKQGIDWGYAIDPFVFIKLNYDRKRKTIYMFKEYSGLKITEEMVAKKLDEDEKKRETIADSSEPRTNDKMRDLFGFNIKGAYKPGGSVERGTRWLSDTVEQIIIDPVRCPLAAKEFINYCLEIRKDGTIVSKYPDKDNHTIDATRYAMEDEINGVTDDFYFARA